MIIYPPFFNPQKHKAQRNDIDIYVLSVVLFAHVMNRHRSHVSFQEGKNESSKIPAKERDKIKIKNLFKQLWLLVPLLFHPFHLSGLGKIDKPGANSFPAHYFYHLF